LLAKTTTTMTIYIHSYATTKRNRKKNFPVLFWILFSCRIH
jgi:hypothetical protein